MPKLLGSGLIPSTRRLGAYLINDTYTTNRAAGAVTGTVAEPGPGERTVTDTGSRLTIASGSLVAASGGSNGDPRLRYLGIGRRTGQIVTGIATAVGAGAAARCVLGAAVSLNGSFTYQLGFGGSGAIRIALPGLTLLTVGSFSVDTAYSFAMVVRSSGIYFFYKTGGNWVFLYASSADSSTNLFWGFAALSSGAWSADQILAPSQVWLPTPLASDGFSAWGTSDGLGHAEGATGIGGGGNGLAWTNQVGTWTAASGVANTSALSGGIAIATLDCGKADVVISVKMTWLAGTGGVIVRYVDANNYILLRHTGTNLQLVKVIASVATTVLDSAATYSAGARIILTAEATKFRCFYNELAVSTEQTISDAAVQSATLVGLRSSDTTNTFDDFVVYARGTGGEYSVLG